jgi:amino acid adenylation domain-containing protein
MDKCILPTTPFVDFEREGIEQSIHKRFERIVSQHSERLAVKMGERVLKYSELNRSANRIARAILDRRGPGSEPIALLLEHGVDVIATIFGVLKAGKFYAAIDPSFHSDRVAYIINDSQANLIVTNTRNMELAINQASNGSTLLNIDEIHDVFSSDNLDLSVSPDDLLIIGYTSGSTGAPKGVIATHRNVAQAIQSAGERLRIGIDDRLTLLHSPSFGSAHGHLYISLLNGASLFPFNVRSEGVDRLARWLQEEKITVYHSSPSLFRQLADSLRGQEKLSNLRLVHLSGAPVTRLDFDLYKDNFGPETLLEFGMGSTEARGIGSAIVDQTFSFPEEGTPIGYPRPHNKILLLDENGREVGPGEVGEIAVKGRNLNRGYWNQPDLTGTKFLPDPTGSDERIVLTGDLGRMLADGFLIHLGRKDLMLKIRGYRVDLGEIEKALLAHPQVKEAGVAAWDCEPGEKSLAGYVVSRHETALNVSELREFLRTKLPDYMIPAAFVFLESLPLVNGKLDRTALPSPDHQRPSLRTAYVQPRSEIEQKLAKIWAEVLQLDEVGIHDNFFDLGGHSLTATRLISRVLDSFRVDVSPKSLFESPSLGGFTQRVEDALHQAQSGTFLPLISVPRGNSLPASFSQRALWFHDQLQPGSCAYNLGSVYRLSGGLDVKALVQSINQIIDRHELLRTVFEAVDGQPMQTILPAMTIELPVVDLSFAASDAVRDSEVRRIAGVFAGQPFDLARGPLLRAALLCLANDDYVLLLAVHHVVFDGWSIGIFAHELSQIYDSFKSGKPFPLPPLHIQYADFAAWQRRRLQGANLESLLSYWRHQLDGLAALKLPGRRRQPMSDGASGARERFQLSQDLSAELRKLSDRTGTTLFMVLLAAYKVALHRYTGQTDIAIGTPTAGRNHPKVEGLIGFFLNMLVLRTDLSGNPTFRELLERIRRVCVDAFAHQDLPFEKLVEELRPTRALTHNPLIQVTFALQNTPRCSLNLMGVTARDLDIGAGVARSFELHLFIEDAPSLRGYVSYNRDLFEADTIRSLIGHLQNLLEGIAVNYDQRIGDLPMLTELEKHQLLTEWNDTKREYPKDKCIHELFENQVDKTPDAIAAIFENQQLTYRELNHRANQLAHRLRKRGVKPETLVAVCMERSLDMVLGILGVLKAGGAYVPIDPDSSTERLKFMLEDTQSPVILTQERFSSFFGEFTDQRVCLDSVWDDLSLESKENPENRVDDKNVAYMIFTSGSTGTPKGVLTDHGGLRNRLQWMQETYPLTATDRVLQKTPFTFDVSVWEFLWPLINGARLVMARPGGHRDSTYLVQLIKSQQITRLHFVPSMLAVFLQDAEVESCTTLRDVFCSGEALSYELQQRFFECTGAALHNLYGPTEASIDVTAWECRRDSNRKVVPIGRPIANTQIYVLDRYLEPVPIGVVGEICVGGEGLARGYLNQPDLTAEKFIYHSFDGGPGQRLYRTGDLGRYLPDGNIEYLGRTDNQVKVRGFRIELGEIEAVLAQHPAIQQAMVLAREDTPGDRRLVAYCVATDGSSPSAHDLRSFLQQKLPDYMMPSVFVFLDSLPLTPNGKLDRKALPAPDQSRPELDDAFAAPRTPIEEILANIWAGVLKLDKVGIHDNFFHLGGHSLLATQVVTRIRDAFKLDLPLRTLFEAPTIHGLVQKLQYLRDKHEVAQTAQIAPVAREQFRIQRTNV